MKASATRAELMFLASTILNYQACCAKELARCPYFVISPLAGHIIELPNHSFRDLRHASDSRIEIKFHNNDSHRVFAGRLTGSCPQNRATWREEKNSPRRRGVSLLWTSHCRWGLRVYITASKVSDWLDCTQRSSSAAPSLWGSILCWRLTSTARHSRYSRV